MKPAYFEVPPAAQKQYSLKQAWRLALPTLLYRCCSKPLEPSEKIALFTTTIFPELAVVWHHCVRRTLGDQVDTVILDSSARLDASLLPGVEVHGYWNTSNAAKIHAFLGHSASKRRLTWICDDDVFPVDTGIIQHTQQAFADPKTATLSFRPRTWWHFDLDGKTYEPSGSYCLVLNRDIFIDQEHLDPFPRDGNTHVCHLADRKLKRFDTLDYANEQLLQRGYTCAIAEEEKRDTFFTGFDGTSIAAFMRPYFANIDALLAYLRDPDDDAWRGNVLPRIVNALLAACVVRELYQELTDRPWVLSTLPERSILEELAEEKEGLLTEGRTFEEVKRVEERLKEVLGV